MSKKVEFISYESKPYCYCMGVLTLRIEGEIVIFSEHIMNSGGSVWFDDDWEAHVEYGPWSVNLPSKYIKYTKEVEKVVNENVPWGCCGGCI